MQLARHSLNALLLALALGTTPAMAEDAEPLAAIAGNDVAAAHLLARDGDDRAQRDIASCVAQRIVGVLEGVQVGEQLGHAVALAARADDGA